MRSLKLRLEEDTIAWGPGRFGQFSVKLAYEFAFDEANRESQSASSTNPEGCRAIWNLIWKTDIPPTVKNFAWRVVSDSLPTWVNKHKRTLETTNICPACGVEPEDNFHPLCR